MSTLIRKLYIENEIASSCPKLKVRPYITFPISLSMQNVVSRVLAKIVTHDNEDRRLYYQKLTGWSIDDSAKPIYSFSSIINIFLCVSRIYVCLDEIGNGQFI